MFVCECGGWGRGSRATFFLSGAYRAFFSERIDNFDYLKQASLQAQVFLQASVKLNVRNLVFAVVSFVSLLLFKKKNSECVDS